MGGLIVLVAIAAVAVRVGGLIVLVAIAAVAAGYGLGLRSKARPRALQAAHIPGLVMADWCDGPYPGRGRKIGQAVDLRELKWSVHDAGAPPGPSWRQGLPFEAACGEARRIAARHRSPMWVLRDDGQLDYVAECGVSNGPQPCALAKPDKIRRF